MAMLVITRRYIHLPVGMCEHLPGSHICPGKVTPRKASPTGWPGPGRSWEENVELVVATSDVSIMWHIMKDDGNSPECDFTNKNGGIMWYSKDIIRIGWWWWWWWWWWCQSTGVGASIFGPMMFVVFFEAHWHPLTIAYYSYVAHKLP